MRLSTHLSGGVFAYTATVTFFELPLTATGVVLAGAAAAAPDVDTLGSTVGRACAPLARRIERRYGHRTLTHCYAAQLAVALAALPLLVLRLPHLYAAVVVGYASHPLLDTWTVQGVRVFWPWSDRRGVFPFYNRQPTAYRTRTGGKADTFFGVIFLLLTLPFAVVQAEGYPRLVRRVQADASAAVRDFLDWSADGYLVSVAVTASDPQHLRRLSGTFEAVGTTGTNTLLVRDPDDGRLLSLGPAYSANFQPDHVLAERGPQVTVSRRQTHLAGRVLADLADLIPTQPDGSPTRHLLDGEVRLAEAARVTPDPFRFDSVVGTDRRLTLRFATLADLERLGLAGHLVEDGTVTVRVFLPVGAPEDYTSALEAGSLRRVVFAHKPSEPPRLLVAEGDTVAAGDTLAVLTTTTLATARLDTRDASSALAALRSEALPASYDPVTLRSRLATAEHDALQTARRHADGFEPAAALQQAEAEVMTLSAQLQQAEARAAEWHRTHRRRTAEAAARLERTRLRLDQATRDATVTAPTPGTVRRIEHRPLSPDRTEVRILLTTTQPITADSLSR